MPVTGRAESLDGSHTYVHPVTGEIYPAVSSILAATNDSSMFLTPWAAKLAGVWTMDHLELVNATFAEAGKGAAVDLIKGQARVLREVAADVGSYCHHVIEALILDSPSGIPPIPDHLINQDYDGEPLTQALVDSIVMGFLNFVTDFDVTFEFAEVTVCNRRLRYAGTLDIGAVINLGALGEKLRLDIDAKTGRRLKATMVVQQAAYTDPGNELWLPNGQVEPLPPFDGAAVLHLRRDYDHGYKLFHVSPADLAAGRAVFAEMRRVYDWQQTAKAKPGRVIYPPLADGSQPLPLLEDIDGWTKCRNLLIAAGHRTLVQVAACDQAQLLALKGFGKKSLEACEAMLAAHNLTLSPKAAEAARTEVA